MRAGIPALYPVWVLYPLLLLGAVAIGMPADAGGRAALFPPVFVNLGLLWGFGRTLRAGRMPMVERFARRIDGELVPERVPYCRAVTRVWCGFFVVNAFVAAGLAIAAPVTWWALYTGVLAYVAMAALFVVEYAVRRIRFRS